MTRPVRHHISSHGHGHRGHGGSAAHSPDSRFNDIASYITDTSSITNPAELEISYTSTNEEEGNPDALVVADDVGDDDETSLMDSATSALTGLTGWTSANGGGEGAATTATGAAMTTMTEVSELGASEFGVSEFGDSENFPVVHSRSCRSGANTNKPQSERTGKGGEINNEERSHLKNEEGEGEEGANASETMESTKISAISFDMDGSVEASLPGPRVDLAPTRSFNSKNGRERGGGHARTPLSVVPPRQATEYGYPSGSSCGRPMSPKPVLKGKKGGYGATPPVSPTASVLSGSSIRSKKQRAPVPPLRDPNMDDTEEDQVWEEDCNYDINPTPMFLVLENKIWIEAMTLLDGSSTEKKDDVWNLSSIFGGGRNKVVENADSHSLADKRQRELRAQARTWIVRRERNGVLRWRMLPLHASLAFGAPFGVVLRIYHLYPGAVRCRNDQGMLPLHHVFRYGSRDKVLELLLDVFPEALSVADDKGRLPLECTPKDGSDNERRTNIMMLFANYRVETAKKQILQDGEEGADNGNVAVALSKASSKDTTIVTEPPSVNIASEPLSPMTPLSPDVRGGTLGAAPPRYTSADVDFNQAAFSCIKPPGAKKSPSRKTGKHGQSKTGVVKAPPPSPLSPKDGDGSKDRYAMLSCDDSENIQWNGNSGGSGSGSIQLDANQGIRHGIGLSTIHEDDAEEETLARKALKSELLSLGEKKRRRKGLRKLFGKKGPVQI